MTNIISWFLVIFLVPCIKSGCYQPRLCCVGRNLTCVSVNTGLPPPYRTTTSRSNILVDPTNAWDFHVEPNKNIRFENQKIHELSKRLPTSPRFAQLKLRQNSTDILKPTESLITEEQTIESRETSTTETTVAPSETTIAKRQSKYKIYFGKPNSSDVSAEQIIYDGIDPVIRYVILNDHIPIRIERLGYLRIDGRRTCYCDEVCRTIADCCDDYEYVCPATDCQLTQWNRWGHCQTKNRQSQCGVGIRMRSREIIRQAQNGGKKCSHLQEEMACNAPCNEVALLLAYEHGGARTDPYKNKLFHRPINLDTRLSQLKSYCVIFEVIWINHGCLDRDLNAELGHDRKVCVECQPTAQISKGNRCTGHGMEGRRTFWSFTGAKQCYGIWTRTEHKSPCVCSESYNLLSNFIFI